MGREGKGQKMRANHGAGCRAHLCAVEWKEISHKVEDGILKMEDAEGPLNKM